MNNIKKLLEEKGMSILQFSEKMGKQYPTIYNLVNRENLDSTRSDTLKLAADVLGVTIDELHGREVEETNLKELAIQTGKEFKNYFDKKNIDSTSFKDLSTSALKSENRWEFIHQLTLNNLSLNAPISDFMIALLQADNDEMTQLGYAFMLGFNS